MKQQFKQVSLHHTQRIREKHHLARNEKDRTAETPCPEKRQRFKKNTSLSANMAVEHVNDLAEDTQCELKKKCVKFLWRNQLQLTTVQKLNKLHRMLFLFQVLKKNSS